MVDNLKPCPFCGGEAETLTAESMHGGSLFGIMCNECRSRGDVYDTESEAIAAWNARYHCGLTDEDYNILLDELGVSERTCRMEYQTEGIQRGWWKCSECGEAMDTIEACGGRKPPRWCGNCGAKVVDA